MSKNTGVSFAETLLLMLIICELLVMFAPPLLRTETTTPSPSVEPTTTNSTWPVTKNYSCNTTGLMLGMSS